MFLKKWITSNNLKPVPQRGIVNKLLSKNWEGSTLTSRDFHLITQALVPFINDIKQQLLRDSSLNNSLRNQIYNHYTKFDISNDYKNFWIQVQNENGHCTFVKKFINQYAQQIAIIFILKQKFLISHAQSTGFKIYPAYYSNLNTLYSKLFSLQIAKDTQLLSFKTGLFNWYDPSAHLIHKSQNSYKLLKNISSDCFIDYISKFYFPIYSNTIHDLILSMLPNKGLLYINESSSHNDFLSFIKKGSKKTFVQSEDKTTYEFFNIISELYYCLIRIQDAPTIHNEFLEKIKLIFQENTTTVKNCDHYYFIKNHFTSSFIKRVHSSKERSFVIQLSHKQIYQPSHKEKNKKLLQNLQLIDHICIQYDLEQHLYFYKEVEHNQEALSSHSFFKIYNIQKNSNSYLEILKDLKAVKEKIRINNSMIISTESSNCHIDYFQDSIVNGTLLSSTQDKNQITHPRFFQALTTQCIPLESLFKTSPMKTFEDVESLPLLEVQNHIPPYVLVIKKQYESLYNCEVDIIPGDSYLGYLKDHGSFENQFFALVPKIPQLSVSLLRIFFQTVIGRQICQLCFRGNSHYRTKIKTLLIPKIIGHLSQKKLESQPLLKNIVHFEFGKESPQELSNHFNLFSNKIDFLFHENPLLTLKAISLLKRQITDFLTNQVSQEKYHIDFYLPSLITELQALNTTPILPRHNDIFLDLKSTKEQLNLTLTSIQTRAADDLHENYRIEFFHNKTSLAIIYTKKYLYEFLKFLLPNMYGVEISSVLQSLNLPKEKELASIIPSYEIDHSIFHELLQKCDILIEKLFQAYIMYKELND